MGYQSVERFAFDRIFTAPQAEPMARGDALLELSALRAEFALLKTDRDAQLALARAQGFEAGLAQARGERDAALLSAVDALHAGVEALDERFDETARRLTSEAAEIALAAADMIAGRAVEAAPTEAIDAAIGRALAQVARGTEIEIRVHPELIEAIEQRIAERQSKDRRKLNLNVVGDVTIAVGDALIGWEQGGLGLDAAARREAVASELETLLRN